MFIKLDVPYLVVEELGEQVHHPIMLVLVDQVEDLLMVY
jgi:hypothetical protein